MFIASDMHYFLIDAVVDSYKVIPIGEGIVSPNLYKIFVQYVIDFFVIGFRIILPVFACILVINVILGILARIAPQMNMFVFGMQLKERKRNLNAYRNVDISKKRYDKKDHRNSCYDQYSIFFIFYRKFHLLHSYHWS